MFVEFEAEVQIKLITFENDFFSNAANIFQ